jgi:hypothetical protein
MSTSYKGPIKKYTQTTPSEEDGVSSFFIVRYCENVYLFADNKNHTLCVCITLQIAFIEI